MRSLFTEFVKQGHKVRIKSINKYSHVPTEWHRESRLPDQEEVIHLDVCYTAPINFPVRFYEHSVIKAAIYNYETMPLPEMWKDSYKHLDYILPSSQFSKQVFLEAGWPEEKLVVIPHGIFPEDFLNKEKLDLRNEAKFRFLNVSIAHYRKNIPLLVEAYYDAFTHKDDVCLVIKTQVIQTSGKKKSRFDINVMEALAAVQDKMIRMGRGRETFPMLELIEQKMPSMIPLYNSCDALVSASSAEGFGLPLLEALAAGMIVVAPNCTGQLDFLNKENSLLVDVAEMKASPQYQYWTVTDKSWTYIPLKSSLAANMRKAYDDNRKLKDVFEKERLETVQRFTWKNAAEKILELE